MGILSKLFGSRTPPPEQAVLVRLDAVGLSAAVYEEYDLASLEDQLEEALGGGSLGSVDGHAVGEGEAVLYLYGLDAEKLFAAIEPVLSQYPLCQNARVAIRQGPPGASEREVLIRAV